MGKTYYIECTEISAHGIYVKSGDVIQGQGMGKTRITYRLVESPFTWSAAMSHVISSNPLPSDEVVIRNLTIDCGFDESVLKRVTRKAIWLTGANNLVERVEVINFGVGAPQHISPPRPAECFVIALQLTTSSPASDSDRIMGTIQDCVITDPGHNGNVNYLGYNPAEITCLLIQGESNSKLGLGGVIRRNKVYNCKYDNSGQSTGQKSPLHGITIAQCTAAEILDNEVVNFDGTGVLIMSCRHEDTIVRANRFLNVGKGIQLAVTKADGRLPADDPYHVRARVTGNTVLLGKYKNVYGDWLQGIGAIIAPGILESPVKNRLEDLIIEHNFVRGVKGDQTENKDCFGVVLHMDTPIFNSFVVQRNVLEVPAAGGDPSLGTAYENALVWINKLTYCQDKAKVRDNRNLVGNELRLKILDYGTTPGTAQWGPFEMSVTRRQGLAGDARSTKLYEEFVGLAPSYSLGWQELLAGSGLVTSVDGEEGRVGIAKLTCGNLGYGTSALRFGGTSGGNYVLPFKLGSNVGRVHIFEFNLKRGMLYDANHKYQVRIGLMDNCAAASDSWAPVGVYLKCQGYWDQNTIRGFAVSSSSPVTFSYVDLWTDSDPPDWHRVRMEVSPVRVLFYVDGALVAGGPITSNIPNTVPLLFAFCVHPESGTSQNRFVLLDSFSYEVI
jgi:hypothetical protein